MLPIYVIKLCSMCHFHMCNGVGIYVCVFKKKKFQNFFKCESRIIRYMSVNIFAVVYCFDLD